MHVDSACRLSDHDPLIITLSTRHRPPLIIDQLAHVTRTPWNQPEPDSSSWELYQQQLNIHLICWQTVREQANDISDDQAAVEHLWMFIRKAITTSAEASIGVKSERGNKYWWKPQVKLAYQKLKEAKSVNAKAAAADKPRTESELRAARTAFRKAAAAAKEESWLEMCSKLGGLKGHDINWSVFHRMCGTKSAIPCPPPGDSRFRPTMYGTAEFIKESYVNMSRTPRDLNLNSSVDLRYELHCRKVQAPTSSAETTPCFRVSQVQAMIDELPNNKSPGPDMITGIMLKKASPMLLHALCSLFNMTWDRGALPAYFKSAKVFSLYKGEGDQADISNYRPISLTSAIGKLLEKLVLEKLTAVVDDKLSIHQAGFRKKRSTVDHLIRVRATIADYKCRGNYPICFLDIKRAYDRVPVKLILNKLYDQFGIRGNLWKWINAFLTNRTFQTIAGNALSSAGSMPNGVPQGSVLSPILFDCFINDIMEVIHPCNGALYADDFAIWTNRLGNNAVDDLNKALRGCHGWARLNAMEFNTKKSAVVFFSLTRSLPSKRVVFGESNIPIPVTDSYKYLGIVFQKNRHWNSHYAMVLTKMRRAQQLILRLCHAWHPPGALVIKKLIEHVMCPILNYGLPVWSITAAWTSKFTSIIGQTAVRALGLPAGSCHAASMVDLGLLDVEHMWQKWVMQMFKHCKHSAAISTIQQQTPISPNCLSIESINTKLPHNILMLCGLPWVKTVAAIKRDQFDRFVNNNSHSPLYPLISRFGPQSYLRYDSRTTATIRARLRHGVNSLRYSLFVRGLSSRQDCPFCHSLPEDRAHAILRCSSLRVERTALFAALHRVGIRNEDDILRSVLGRWMDHPKVSPRRLAGITSDMLHSIDAMRQRVEQVGSGHI